MKAIKAIIFDMDGVLIDAREWHYESLNMALKLFGLEISRYDHLVTYDGLPTRRKLEMLSVEKSLPKKLHPLINAMKQKYTIKCVLQHCRPVFAHQQALSRLRHQGYRMAVCSNSVRNSVEMMMRQAGLLEYIEFFLSNEDVKAPKPSPDIYLTAMARLGLKPRQCLIVEDNEHGIRAAEASGAHLLKVQSANDVHYQNLIGRIQEIEAAAHG